MSDRKTQIIESLLSKPSVKDLGAKKNQKPDFASLSLN